MSGLFFNALLRVFGISTSPATAAVGGLLVTALVAWTTYYQIQISARLIGIFLAVEAAFVTFLAAFIVVRQGMRGNLTLDPFNPAADRRGNPRAPPADPAGQRPDHGDPRDVLDADLLRHRGGGAGQG